MNMLNKEIIQLLKQARNNGITIFVEHSKLKLKVEKGKTIDPELLQQIKANQQALLSFLEAETERQRGSQQEIPSRLASGEVGDPSRLSYAQERLWFVDQLGGSTTYHVPTVIRLEGPLQFEALQQAFVQIIERHEILRTTYLKKNGVAYQQVMNADQWQLQYIEDGVFDSEKSWNIWLSDKLEQPFDLSRDYMLRAHLLRRSEAEHTLVMVIHHIATDAWSMSILIDELTTCYATYLRGEQPVHSPLSIQYADYADWQRNQLPDQQMEKQFDWWTKKLQGVEPLALPTDYPRPAVQSNRGDRISFSLDKELSKQLSDLSRDAGTTLFMTLLAVFKVLLYRYTGQTDISVGTPVVNRNHKELEPLIGFFLNNLCLRSDLSSNPGFLDFLRQLTSETLTAYNYQDVPFEQVVDRVIEQRDLSRSPLFQTVLVLNNTPPPQRLTLEGIEWVVEPLPVIKSSVDLHVLVNQLDDGLQFELTFCKDLFVAETIERLGEHFQQLLQSVVAKPATPIFRLPMLTAVERTQLLEIFNDNQEAFPFDKNMLDLIQSQVEERPEAVAIQFEDQLITYRELEAKSNQVAHFLLGLGLQKASLVGLCVERNADMIPIILGIMKAGAAYLPIDPAYPTDRLNYLIVDSNVDYIFSTATVQAAIPSAHQSKILLIDTLESQLERAATSRPDVALDPHDVAYTIYTSGSTGRPKGVLVEHKGLVNLSLNQIEAFGLEHGTKVLQFASLSFDASCSEIFTTLGAGACLLIPSKKQLLSKELLASFIQEKSIEVATLPPSYQVSMEEALLGLKTLVSAGEPLNIDVAERMEQAGVKVINAYGPTENTVCVSLSPKATNYGSKVSIGGPLANVEAYVFQNEFQLSPIGVTGELYVGGVQLARGYLNQVELTAERFVQTEEPTKRLYRTGDLVCWLPDGTLSFVGRADAQVKIRGHRIELGEIEQVLLAHEAVQDCTVLAKHMQGVNKLIAFVVPTQTFDKEALSTYLESQLPAYMMPAFWLELAELPVNVSGKVDRKALLEYPLEQEQKVSSGEPTTDLEVTLCNIWKELLGLEAVGIHDNFFELGGDSIICIQAVSRAHHEGYLFQVADMFERQTIADLVPIVERAVETNAVVSALEGELDLTPIQHWFFEQEHEDAHHYNQAVLLQLDKAITASTLQKIVEQLMEQHDVLRTRFWQEGGVWHQSYSPTESQLEVKNLSHTSNWQDQLTDTCETWQRSFKLAEGPLSAFVLFQTPQEETYNRFFIVIHHLQVDGLSWRILLHDFQRLLSAADLQQPLVLGEKSASYHSWVEHLTVLANGEMIRSEQGYWRSVINAYEPLDTPPEIEVAASAEVSLNLSPSLTTALLTEVHQAYNTEINDILLAALFETLSNWTQREHLVIGLEGHGREQLGKPIDISSTVGWFTSLYPVLFSRDSQRDIQTQIIATKEQIRSIPHKGLGYGLLKYLQSGEDWPKGQAWDITFNYLGQLDHTLQMEGVWPAAENIGAMSSLNNRDAAKIAVNCAVQGGVLVVDWSYAADLFPREEMKDLAEEYLANLEFVILHCQAQTQATLTPADYGLSGYLTHRELIDFLAHLPVKQEGMKLPEALYPLSPLQAGMLFHELFKSEAGLYINQFVCDFWNLKPETLKVALQALLNKHTALRTAFFHEDFEHPLQGVFANVELPFQIVDYTKLSEKEQDAMITSVLAEDRLTPFNIARPPLMRFTLFQLTAEKYRLVWTHHHIICDGWSSPVMMNEVLQNYFQLDKGLTLTPPKEDRYQDYIQYIERRNKEAQRNFWSTYLADLDKPTLLPFVQDGVERNKGGLAVQTEWLRFDGGFSKKVQAFSRQHHITINSLLQGVWAYLLSRYTGQDQVCFGVTVSGRPTDLLNATERVGLYINTIPLVSTIPPAANVLAWLNELQKGHTLARDYQYSALNDIQRWQGLQGDLFDSILVFENYPEQIDEQPNGENGLSIGASFSQRTTNYLLTITVDAGARLNIEFNYNGELLDKQRIKTIKEHFGRILEQIVLEPSLLVRELKLLSTADYEALLKLATPGSSEANQEDTVVSLFEAYAAKAPDQLAVVCGDGTLTYSALNTKANQLATYLKDTYAIGRGDLVGILMDRSEQLAVAMLAVMKAGAAYVPIDINFPSNRKLYILGDAKPKALLTEPLHFEAIREQYTGAVEYLTERLSTLPACSQNLPLQADAKDLIYVIYTSGSTGQPKGVLIEHHSIINYVQGIQRITNLQEGAYYASITDISTDLGNTAVFSALCLGGTIDLIKKELLEDPIAFFDYCRKRTIDLIKFTPTLLSALLPSARQKKVTFTHLLLGGEASSWDLVADIRTHFKVEKIINHYGPTETTIGVLVNDLTHPKEEVAIAPPIGQPILNTRAYILDEQLRPAPVGCIGRIYLGGAGLARGYLNRPALTADRFIPDPFRDAARVYDTGDLGRWLPDGKIEFLGRKDNQVKIRGYRVELGEIEQTILQHKEIQQCIVDAKRNQKGEAVLVAYVVGRPGFDQSKLKEELQAQLPPHMIPTYWITLDQLPRTANDKVDRKALPDIDPKLMDRKAYQAPETATEKTIAHIWERLLAIEQVGLSDDFFALGGHSLLAMRLVAAIRKELQVHLSVKAIFNHPTIEELVHHISSLTDHSALPEVTRRAEITLAPLSYAQERLWFIDQFEGSLAYHIPRYLKLSGEVDVEALELAFRAIIDRHEVLRTVYVEEEGQAFQRVQDAENWSLKIMPSGELQEPDWVAKEIQCPFDLTKDFMLRAYLMAVQPDEYQLLIIMHHIAADGWSTAIIVDELVSNYTYYRAGQTVNNTSLPIQYADYAQWQRTHLTADHLQAEVEWWEAQLSGLTPLNLPTDFSRPPIRLDEGRTRSFLLEKSLVDQLQALADTNEVTLFMTVLAAFKVLLHRYSGQTDIALGVPVANRDQMEVEGLIGFFVNTLVLRTDLSGEPSFEDLLGQVRKNTLSAYSHQQLPFEKVVEQIVKERDPSTPPLFQVMFAWNNNQPVNEIAIDGLDISGIDFEHKLAMFDLTFTLTPSDKGLEVSINYCTALFAEATIKRMENHIRNLLQSVVKDSREKISRLSLMDRSERQQILTEYNPAPTDFPANKTVVDLFEEQVRKHPEALAIGWGEKKMSYQAFDVQVNRLANYLQQQGVTEGQVVAIALDKEPDMLIGIWAILKTGAAYLPIDIEYPTRRVEYIIKESAAVLLLSKATILQDWQLPTAIACIELDNRIELVANQANTAPPTTRNPEHLAYVLYTSGSTGRPKACTISHRNLVNHNHWMWHEFGFGVGEKILQRTTYIFDASVWELSMPFCYGASLHLCEREAAYDAEALVALIQEHQISTIQFVPSILEAFVNHLDVDNTIHFPALKRIFCGGAALSPSLVSRFHKQVSCNLHNLYGPSEATIDVCFKTLTPAQLSEVSIPIGKPIANCRLYVLDQHQQLQAVGIPGELYVAGAPVGNGYLNRPDLTAERFMADTFYEGQVCYKTGDLAKWSASGDLIYLGRADDQVKIRGLRIELGEIEQILQMAEAVRECAVLVRTDSQGEKHLLAYYTATSATSSEELESFLLSHLPIYMVPRRWMQLEVMPVKLNGKIDRQSLPELDLFGEVDKTPKVPQTATEVKVMAIWESLLKVDSLSIEDDFFRVGGHSLMAVRLCSAIKKELGVRLTVKDIFTYSTITTLAQYLDALNPRPQLPSIVKMNQPDGPLPLSFAQERLWFIDQLEGTQHYHIPTVLRLKGKLDASALAFAFYSVITRHEVLKTLYRQKEGTAYQYLTSAKDWTIRQIDPEERPLKEVIQEEFSHSFDLEKELPIRVSLIKESPHTHLLLINLHHIAADGWSMSILIQELVEGYRARLERRTTTWSTLNLQYHDYAAWQREYLTKEVMSDKLDWWALRLQDLSPLELPTDFSRPSIQSTRGGKCSFEVGLPTKNALQQLSHKAGATAFITLLTAFKAWLHRYTGQQDIVVGTPVANRNDKDLENLIGFFVNTIVLRTQWDGDPRFIDLLEQIKTGTISALSYQDVPFEKVVERLDPKRDLSRSPLFQVMFIYDNIPSEDTIELPELELSSVKLPQQHTKFDLTCTVAQTQESIRIELEFCRDLFAEETILRMGQHFTQLLTDAFLHPHKRLSQLDLMSPEEQHQVVKEFNHTATTYPLDKSLVDLFLEQVNRTPNAIALVFREHSMTYLELDQESNQFAQQLIDRGLRSRELVALFVDRSLEMMVALWGILKAGGTYVPIDPEYPSDRISYILTDTSARWIISDENNIAKLTKISGPSRTLININAINSHVKSCALPTVTIDSSSAAYVIYTSGSTGRPKGVVNEHAGVVNRLCWAQDYFDLGDQDTILQKTTYSFDVSVWELFWPSLVGAKLVIAEPDGHKDAQYLLETIERYEVTTIHFVPSMLEAFLTAIESGNCKSLQRVICSGEALRWNQVKLHRAKLGETPLFNLYGPTEAAIDVTAWAVPTKEILPYSVPIGSPVANTQMYVLDKHLQPVPIGVPGELHIGGAQVARGYLNRPLLTSEKFITDPFEQGGALYKTGDVAKWLPNGNLLYLGRNDHQVKIRGFRIELGEIERALEDSQWIRSCVVVAKANQEGHQRLLAYVVAQAGFSEEAIERELKEQLPAYMVPSIWINMEQLPLNANGKINRKALPEPNWDSRSVDNLVLPNTQIEKDLALIWQDLLGVDQLGIHDNFFRAGGDSIVSIQVVSRARRLQYHIKPQDIFKYQTIAELANYLTTAQSQSLLAEQGLLTGELGLLPIQYNFFEAQHEVLDHYNQALLLQIEKGLDRARLAQAISVLGQKHDVLRLSYKKEMDGWKQFYSDRAVELKQASLSHLSEVSFPEHLATLCKQYQQQLKVVEGQIAHFVLIETPLGHLHNRLLIVIHHLAVDGVSWRILLEDLHDLLTREQPELSFDKATSYRQWQSALEKYAATDITSETRAYWMATMEYFRELPVDYRSTEAVRYEDLAHLDLALDPKLTVALTGPVHQAYNTTINDLLLCALGKAIGTWAEQNAVMIGLEGHGREALSPNLDVSRTMGWFTSLYPASLRLDWTLPIGELIKGTKEQLRQIPDHGLSYGLLRFLHPDEQTRASYNSHQPWEILFNYLGQLDRVIQQDGPLSPATESAGKPVNAKNRVGAKMAINGSISKGRLQLTWSYATTLYQEKTIAALANSFKEYLTDIIHHCLQKEDMEKTPSDFSLQSKVSLEELDAFFQEEEPASGIDILKF